MPFTSQLNLADLNGTTGFVINGINADETSGMSVNGAGDVNGDGIDDLIIDSYYSSYVVFGRTLCCSTSLRLSLNLADLDGSNGFVINSIERSYAAVSVSGAGDVNGDGFDDLIIGADEADPLMIPQGGESYVVFGRDTGFSASLDPDDLDGSNGFVINGIANSDHSGISVSGAGDVNGDGIDDLIIGAYWADPNGNSEAGESYVVFGRDTGFSTNLNLADLDGSNGFVINGIAPGDHSGISVSGAGDVNDDGFDDLVIGADRADPSGNSEAGESYVVFGRDTGFSASLNLADLDGINGFVINGIDAYDFSGASVSGARDVNGDGVDDLIIGAYGATPNGNSEAGESYVVFGRDTGFSASLNLADLDGSNGFVINGIDAYDFSGASVSSAGDVNGDGVDDLIIGAHWADPNSNSEAGESYVVFGRNTGFSASLNLADLDGSNGFVINGIDAYDFSGASVSSAGDVNGDGVDDLIIGALYADPNGNSDAGESYVVFGQLNRPTVSIIATDATAAEPGTDTGTFTITRTGNTCNPLTVAYSVAGTATNGTDYLALTGIVEIPARQASATITVISVDDKLVDDTETVVVSLTDTDDYDLDGSANSATVIITDNDEAGYTLSQATAILHENGSTASLTVALTSQPISDVVLNLASSDPGEAIVSPASLTFTPTNWDTAQPVTLTGVDDTEVDGNQASTVTISVMDASSDDAFDPLADQIITVTTTDNDVVDSGGGTGDTGNGTGDDNGTNAPTTPTTPTPGPIIGTPQPDVLTGTDGDDTIIGLAGNDRLFGNGGNDTIFGGEGNDRLFGGDGDDILIGGDGVDQMTGSDGADIFVIRPGKGFARIRDFDLNEDKLGIVKGEIRLGAIEVRPFQGNNTILLLNGKIIAGLEGINPSDLRRGNVALVQSDSLS